MAEQKTKRWKHLIIKILHVERIFWLALEGPRKRGLGDCLTLLIETKTLGETSRHLERQQAPENSPGST